MKNCSINEKCLNGAKKLEKRYFLYSFMLLRTFNPIYLNKNFHKTIYYFAKSSANRVANKLMFSQDYGYGYTGEVHSDIMLLYVSTYECFTCAQHNTYYQACN